MVARGSGASALRSTWTIFTAHPGATETGDHPGSPDRNCRRGKYRLAANCGHASARCISHRTICAAGSELSSKGEHCNATNNIGTASIPSTTARERAVDGRPTGDDGTSTNAGVPAAANAVVIRRSSVVCRAMAHFRGMVESRSMGEGRVGRGGRRVFARPHKQGRSTRDLSFPAALPHISRPACRHVVRGRRVRLNTDAMYIELHARSAFTFLEGASIPEELIDTCAKLGMPAMALLDRDGLYGSARFYLGAKKAKLQAHIGAEITTRQCRSSSTTH